MFVTAFRRRRGAKTDDAFPWTVPALRALRELRFEMPVTFLIGENGCGKSTLLEHVRITRDFLTAPGRYLRYLTRSPDEPGDEP